MRRVTLASLRRACSIAAALLMAGTVIALAPATLAAASSPYPSMSLNHVDGIKVGETLKVTGKNFPAGIKVTVYQCNGGMLDSPNGVFNSSTCDLKSTVTTTTSSTGTLAVSFKVAVKDINGQPGNNYAEHTGTGDDWCWSSSQFAPAEPFVTGSPTETWLKKQTVKITGLDIPVVAGATYSAAECNPKVLTDPSSADCGPSVPVTVNSAGKATGKLTVVMGTVGNGTCGTSSADEVCYLALSDTPTTFNVIGPINFYES